MKSRVKIDAIAGLSFPWQVSCTFTVFTAKQLSPREVDRKLNSTLSLVMNCRGFEFARLFVVVRDRKSRRRERERMLHGGTKSTQVFIGTSHSE